MLKSPLTSVLKSDDMQSKKGSKKYFQAAHYIYILRYIIDRKKECVEKIPQKY